MEPTFETVVERYSAPLYRLAYSWCGNREDAEDVLQEVFLKYLRKKPRFAEETLCPVAGSYACVDGRDLITLWSIDDPADAVTLDVTEQMRGGAYCERIEHCGAAVTVSLTRETDGSCTLLVEWNGEEESV